MAHSLYLCLSRDTTVAPKVEGYEILTREYREEKKYPFKANLKSWTMKHLSYSVITSYQNGLYRDRKIRISSLKLEAFRKPDRNLSNNHSVFISKQSYILFKCFHNVRKIPMWEKRVREEKALPKIKTTITTNHIIYFWLNLEVEEKLRIREIKISQQRWEI